MPCTVYAAGHSTGLLSEVSPSLISAVEVMIFMVEPGGTVAVRAKSLNWALLAIARMSPVDGWSTTIALFSAPATAFRAARSACALIVVATRPAPGGVTAAWLPGTAWLAEFSIWTDRPGVPGTVG